MAAYRQKVARYYNSRIKNKAFRAGDLMLRRAAVSQSQDRGKLAPNWEGPYEVKEVVRPGTYYLKELGGADLPRSWSLKTYECITDDSILNKSYISTYLPSWH